MYVAHTYEIRMNEGFHWSDKFLLIIVGAFVTIRRVQML